ncbi:MAG: 5-(carboxyamino)imidazole ribonucleotide synthase [Gammaproteobacteria bacterium]|nr:5-(carboxyamino)imidazole ribonucleotide synthase [Gammaproteobacteria bacterium]
MILPGSTIGVMGGGQLGRMFVIAARTMGYKVAVLDPDPGSPAGAMADYHVQTAYDDTVGLARMAELCAAITTEFENVPAESFQYLQDHCQVHPSPAAVALTRDRIREKSFLRDSGVATAPFLAITDDGQLDMAINDIGTPALLKTATGGYDGKGQVTIHSAADVHQAYQELGQVPCVLEKRVALAREVSVVLARNESGQSACFPVAENEHINGILDTTIVPARIPATLAQQARDMATRIADRLQYVGTMAVEMFVTEEGELLVNEIAPRPHNSGHFTLNATVTCQFEQQVRMLCGLPAGDTRLLSPVVMINLLGDIWNKGEPDWASLLVHPEIKLHLYGKAEARIGRKMGHFNVLHADPDHALELSQQAKTHLGILEK